jgi:hypothetical protein
VNAIEINATFYKLQRPDLFERGRRSARRLCLRRERLALLHQSAGARRRRRGDRALSAGRGSPGWGRSSDRSCGSSPNQALRSRRRRRFPGAAAARAGRLPLRHAIEAQHESFREPRFAELAGDAQVAICLVDGSGEPGPDHQTAPFVYARLKNSRPEESAGYPQAELDVSAKRGERVDGRPEPARTIPVLHRGGEGAQSGGRASPPGSTGKLEVMSFS